MGKYSLTIYDGVNEIGGTKILVENKSELFFLDFGKQHSKWLEYYEYPFSLPKTIDELIYLGLIPPPRNELENLYTNVIRGEVSDINGECESKVASCIFSHAHTDHTGYAFLLNRRIKLNFGLCSWRIIEARLNYGLKSNIESNYYGFGLENGNINVFKSGSKIEDLDADVTAFAVDHSVPGSYGFLIDLGDVRIAYTGDFRWHGPARNLTSIFADKLKDFDADFIICEGTQFSNINSLTELDVEREAERLIKSSRKLIVANVSPLDIDRLYTFFKVARSCNRVLVLNMKLAAILARLSDLNIMNFPSLNRLLVYYSEKKRLVKWKRSFIAGVAKDEYYSKLSLYEYELGLKFRDLIRAEELISNPDNYILVTSYYSYDELMELYRCSKQMDKFDLLEGGVYIMSTSEPFQEEMEIKFEKLKNWIKILRMMYYPIHSSGHIRPLDLKSFLMEVKAKNIIPIHTEAQNFIENFLKDTNVNVVVPIKGKKISLTCA